MPSNRLYTTLALVILTLLAVPVGGALVLAFAIGESPCVMCWEQRIGMIIIATIGLFILRYGPRPRYLGLAVLVGGWGIFMGTRHTALHAARDIGQGFAMEILGAHTYTWALFIYWACIVTMGVLLLMLTPRDVAEAGPPRTLRGLEKIVYPVFCLLVAGNALQAVTSTGPPPFAGQSDPIRFSFNPKHWVWSLDEWKLGEYPITMRGRFGVNRPDITTTTPGHAAGPFVNLPTMQVIERRQLSLPLRGTPTDLAYESSIDRFVLTTQEGVYVLPPSMDRIERSTVVDTEFSIDLATIGATAWLDAKTILLVGENKSFITIRENAAADADANFRYFLEPGPFDDAGRGRFTTVRARLMFSMAAAYDAETESIYTITAPNRLSRRIIVSRFDRGDMTLSEEFIAELDPDAGLALGEKRSLEELFISAATVHEGKLYALSANFGTLLTIDLQSHLVTAAQAIPDLRQPVGMAFTARGLHVVCADGAVVLVR